MLLWSSLFLLIIAISFLLAYQSMKDFAEKPSALGKDYALFLVRNPQALSTALLEALHNASLQIGHIITLERIFKGSKSAVVIFGPKSILDNYPDLNLLELEDYTNVPDTQVAAWEVGAKDAVMFHFELPTVFKQLPKLEHDEQFWWQLTMQSNKNELWPSLKQKSFVQEVLQFLLKSTGLGTGDDLASLNKILAAHPEAKQVAENKNAQKTFRTEIRAVVVSASDKRRADIAFQMENIDNGKLIKLPKAYTSAQILTLYRQRAKLASTFHPLTLTVDEVLSLAVGN